MYYSFVLIIGNWEILLSKTKFKCGSITNCPAPAKNAFNVHGNEWIVSVVDGGYLKMVKLKVTGEKSYDWIETKYNKEGEYDKSKCEDSFSEECFVLVCKLSPINNATFDPKIWPVVRQVV